MLVTPRQPMQGLGLARPIAWLSTVAFAFLAISLAAIGSLPKGEALWAVAAVALAFVPTGWWAGAGIRRRSTEAALLPAAFSLTMIGGGAMRRMLAPTLLILAAWSAVAAAWNRVPRARRPLLAAFFGLSARAAVGLGLTGFNGPAVAITLALAAVGPWAAARRHGRRAAELTALGLAAIPWQRSPLIGLGALIAFVVWGLVGDLRTRDDLVLRWLPGVAAAALLGAGVGPWAGLPVHDLLPAWGWPLAVLIVVALILTPRLATGVSGILWLLVILVVGPASPPPPDHRGFDLGGDRSRVTLPASTGDPYVIDVAVERDRGLNADGPLAVFSFGGGEHPLQDGGEGAEDVIWRPRGSGKRASWQPAVRYRFVVPAGEQPVISRHPRVADDVEVRVEVWGSERPTPPRDWALPQWLLAGAATAALIQFLSGTWRLQVAIVPWIFLVLGSLVARASVEPLRLVGERLAVDVALVAVLAAWLPAARFWARRRRVFVSVAALLVPLALATPHLTPSMYGDEPFHLLVMESLAADHDLDISDDLDLENHPQNQLYAPGAPLFHSPALGVFLFPGYLIGGRAGALVLLALMGALLAALLARRARGLGFGHNLVALLVLLIAITYPVATFSTQIWPEIPGALAVAAILVLAAAGGRWSTLFLAVGAVAVKTRLGLVAFPPALAAWLGRGRLAAVRGFLFLGIAAGASLAVGWLTMGHPLGPYRRLYHLIPDDPGLVLRVLGGLGFDPAGGLAFTAPLLLVALVGMAELWRRGGPGERALLVGCGLTLIALLHSPEWYAGGSPPARYLVPMVPAFALAGGMLLSRPRRWRRLTELLLVPTVVAWWVLITRPHFSVNPGDGGYWLADALSRRFGADARSLFPSFLVPNASTVVVPVVLLTVVFLVAWMTTRIPGAGTAMQRAGIALWLAAAATLVINLDLRYDRVVEVEAPQVRHRGGVPVPPAGTFSRYTYRRGWRLDDGHGLVVPLHLREHAEVWLEGWFLGTVKRGGRLEVRWNDGEVAELRLQGNESNLRVLLPPPPGAGKHRLAIELRCPPHRAVVLDRVVVGGR
jgi:hypothetical protein